MVHALLNWFFFLSRWHDVFTDMHVVSWHKYISSNGYSWTFSHNQPCTLNRTVNIESDDSDWTLIIQRNHSSTILHNFSERQNGGEKLNWLKSQIFTFRKWSNSSILTRIDFNFERKRRKNSIRYVQYDDSNRKKLLCLFEVPLIAYISDQITWKQACALENKRYTCQLQR